MLNNNWERKCRDFYVNLMLSFRMIVCTFEVIIISYPLK